MSLFNYSVRVWLSMVDELLSFFGVCDAYTDSAAGV